MGKSNRDWNWCNLVIKFVLFLINTVIWILGMVLLAIGIYVQVESTFDELMLGSLLTSPAIIIIILGSLLLILGFCGCLGALLEIFFLLIIYSILLSLIVLLEIGVVVFVFLQQDQAYDSFESLLLDSVVRYFDDLNVRDVINLIQQLLQCCGVSTPNDWQRNIYFNCSSPAFQRCSVPFSCCQLDEGEVINLQCGYRTLDETANRDVAIYQTGCLPAAQNLIRGNLYVVGGVGIGLLVFQIINIMLASGLAVDVYKEKKILKSQKKLAKDNEMHSKM